MIHSLSGGVIKENIPVDFAKVKLKQTGTIAWYLCTHLPNLKINDKVLVPYGVDNSMQEAQVLRIDRQISPQVTPIPLKHAKKIEKVL